MPRFLRLYFICFFILLAGCSSKGESRLAKSLSAAVKENKLSQKKADSIMNEYDMLRAQDKDIARRYVEQILNAIEMGGDSTHIDVARRLVVGAGGKVKV